MASVTRGFKLPESVLVVIHTPVLDVLLIRRADSGEHWQSVTGSRDSPGEPFHATAAREVQEETGIDALAPGCTLCDWGLQNIYPIWPQWLHRYAPGVLHNTEHLFSLRLPERLPVVLSAREHTDSIWLPWREAAQRCFSPSNAEAILLLPQFSQQ
ncbi:MAG TPA: dihydroneopterin triphosphate diphosphatase [Burkholderiaceae bacterium]